MSVFVLRPYAGIGKTLWTLDECKDRAEALDRINGTQGTATVIEGVRLKLEPVTQVTQYQFARGT
jgi:hypothetical protein